MSRLIIVGAGSYGREIYSWVSTCPIKSQYGEIVFIDDNGNSLTNHDNYPPIIGSISEFSPNQTDVFLLGIAEPKTKVVIVEKLLSKGCEFIQFIHPSCQLGINVSIGVGSVLLPNVIVSCDASIADFVSVNVNSSVGHDVQIGKYSTLSSHVDLMGFATLGTGVFIGSHGCVLPKVLVEDFATVGVSSAVLRRVDASKTVLGVPAKPIG
jgi:sugar O-acyltransferase (sialic acid O-acetyltransferase NeuD family)